MSFFNRWSTRNPSMTWGHTWHHGVTSQQPPFLLPALPNISNMWTTHMAWHHHDDDDDVWAMMLVQLWHVMSPLEPHFRFNTLISKQRIIPLSEFCFLSGQVESSCQDLRQKRGVSTSDGVGYTVIVQWETESRREGRGGGGRGGGAGGTGRGGAPEAELENFRYIRRKGGAHCWKRQLCRHYSTPFFSLPAPSRMHTQIRFSYIFCAAYHVIAETYAHWWADMCAGPWVHREGEGYMVHWKKILLILLLSSFFFFLFSFLVSSSAVLSAFFSARCKILPLALPSTAVPYETKLDFWFCLLVLAFLFVLFFSLTLSFPPLSCVLSTVETSRTKTPKMMNNSPWQLRGFCLGSYFWANSIPPFFFFFFFSSCPAPPFSPAPPFFLFPSLFSPPPLLKSFS